MNSWTQTQNQNQIPYNPYGMGTGMSFNMRGPIYRADPIHGENAAWQFPMGNNSEIYLPDADKDIIWWIRTDMNGNRTVTPFDVAPHVEPEPVDVNAILARLNALEEKVNAKQNKSNAKRNQSATTVGNSAELNSVGTVVLDQ